MYSPAITLAYGSSQGISHHDRVILPGMRQLMPLSEVQH